MFDPAPSSACFTEHAAGADERGDRLWSLLNLELWHRTFIDGEGVQTLPGASGSLSRLRLGPARRRRHRRFGFSGLKRDRAGLWPALVPRGKGGCEPRTDADAVAASPGAHSTTRPGVCRAGRSLGRPLPAPPVALNRLRPDPPGQAGAVPGSTLAVGQISPGRGPAPARPSPLRSGDSGSPGACRAVSANCSQEEASICASATFLFPAVNLPGTLSTPVGALHPQRRVRRSGAVHAVEKQPSGGGRCLRAAAPEDAPLRGRRTPGCFDAVLAVSDAESETFTRLFPPAAGSHRADRGGHRLLQALRLAAARDPACVHGLHGLAAERRRDALLLPRASCRWCARRSRTRLSHCRPRADAGGAEPRRRGRRRRHRPRRRRASVHGPGGRLHRAASHRRRHPAQDFRSHGDGQGGGLDDGRRRGPAGRQASICCSPTSPAIVRARDVVRLIRDLEQRERIGDGCPATWWLARYDWSAVAGALKNR